METFAALYEGVSVCSDGVPACSEDVASAGGAVPLFASCQQQILRRTPEAAQEDLYFRVPYKSP